MSAGLAKKITLYRNCDVVRLVAIIPRGHKHLRMVIELEDQVVVLHEATVAAIVRAYVDVVTHPKRRSIELVMSRFKSGDVKPGYAECQLVESSATEEELLLKWGDAVTSSPVEDKKH